MRFQQIFLIASLLISTLSFAAEYSMDEVAKHKGEDSCWIVIDKEVFDVTAYLSKHPAPKVILLKSCGKDVSEDFKTKKGLGKPHSDKAMQKKATMKIGTLK